MSDIHSNKKHQIEKTLIYNGQSYDNFTIDEEGNVRNLKTNNILKKSILKHQGYYYVTLPMGQRGKVKSIRVHKAVAETFIPNPNNYPFVHHKDENKLNCHVSNLEWVTPKLNTQYHHEKLKENTEFFNNRKLSSEEVKEIRKIQDAFSRRELSEIYNVSKTTITNICNNKFYQKELTQ